MITRKSTFVKFILLGMIFLFILPSSVSAQTVSEKNKIFTLKITNQMTADQAVKLDGRMLEKKGIVECHTDYLTGVMTVKVISQIDYPALQTVLNYFGYECNSQTVTFKEE